MKNFGIIRNDRKDPDFATTHMIISYLRSQGAAISIVQTADDTTDDMECLIVLGGDGTMLQASKIAIVRDLPMLGINLGTLGYLAEVDKESIKTALNCLLSDEFTIEKRMMLSGTLYHNGQIFCHNIALNDIVISREGAPRIINFKNYVNHEFLNLYQADAIILATATGSTGYSLSAGGPIISPTANLIMMTALAPHTLNARSVIFPSTDELMVEIGQGRIESVERARVDFDGAGGYQIETGDTVVVRKAGDFARIIKIKPVSFLEVLRTKLSDN